MSDFLPAFTASANFSGGTGGALVFGSVPSAGLAATLTPFFKGDKGLPGEQGPIGPDGSTNLPDMTLIFDNGLV